MADNLLDNYNPLYDIHLRQYFALPHMQKHLQKMGLLESTLNLHGDEVYARHHAMMDMMLKNREAQLVKMAELRKKLDAAEKVEICRRIRSGQSPESYRRGKPSRSLSRSRAAQSTGARQRRFSNSFEDKDFVQNIEEKNQDPIDHDVNDPYKRLSANAKRFNYLHKLDDKTLIAYKDNLGKQLQRLERFREISFGPHSVARQPPPPQTSWFFRRRSLPSLTASAPGSTLKEPLRSVLNMRGRKANVAGNKLNASHDSRTSCPPTTRKRRDVDSNRLPPIATNRPKMSAKPPAPASAFTTKLPPTGKKASPSRGRPSGKRMTTTTTTTTTTHSKVDDPLPSIQGRAIFGGTATAPAVTIPSLPSPKETLSTADPSPVHHHTPTPPSSPVLETQRTFDRSTPTDGPDVDVPEVLSPEPTKQVIEARDSPVDVNMKEDHFQAHDNEAFSEGSVEQEAHHEHFEERHESDNMSQNGNRSVTPEEPREYSPVPIANVVPYQGGHQSESDSEPEYAEEDQESEETFVKQEAGNFQATNVVDNQFEDHHSNVQEFTGTPRNIPELTFDKHEDQESVQSSPRSVQEHVVEKRDIHEDNYDDQNPTIEVTPVEENQSVPPSPKDFETPKHVEDVHESTEHVIDNASYHSEGDNKSQHENEENDNIRRESENSSPASFEHHATDSQEKSPSVEDVSMKDMSSPVAEERQIFVETVVEHHEQHHDDTDDHSAFTSVQQDSPKPVSPVQQSPVGHSDVMESSFHQHHSPAQQSPVGHSPVPQSPVQQQQSPVPQSPVQHSPAPQSPVQHSPAPHSPIQHQSPAAQSPVQQSPAPVQQSPVPSSPVQQHSPAPQSPVQHSPVPVQHSPAPSSPVQQQPSPVPQSPVQQQHSPAPQSPVQQHSPVGHSPAPQSPVQQQHSPAPQSPMERSPVSQSPVQHSPAPQSPMQQSFTQQEHHSASPTFSDRSATIFESQTTQDPMTMSVVMTESMQSDPSYQPTHDVPQSPALSEYSQKSVSGNQSIARSTTSEQADHVESEHQQSPRPASSVHSIPSHHDDVEEEFQKVEHHNLQQSQSPRAQDTERSFEELITAEADHEASSLINQALNEAPAILDMVHTYEEHYTPEKQSPLQTDSAQFVEEIDASHGDNQEVHAPEAYELTYDNKTNDAMMTSIYQPHDDEEERAHSEKSASPVSDVQEHIEKAESIYDKSLSPANSPNASLTNLDQEPDVQEVVREWDQGNQHIQETTTSTEYTTDDGTARYHSETVTVITKNTDADHSDHSPRGADLSPIHKNIQDNGSTDSLIIHDEPSDYQMTQSMYQPSSEPIEHVEEKEWDTGDQHIHEVIKNKEFTDETGKHVTHETVTTVIKSTESDDLKNNNDDDSDNDAKSVHTSDDEHGTNGNLVRETTTTTTTTTTTHTVPSGLPEGGILVDDGDEKNISSL